MSFMHEIHDYCQAVNFAVDGVILIAGGIISCVLGKLLFLDILGGLLIAAGVFCGLISWSYQWCY